MKLSKLSDTLIPALADHNSDQRSDQLGSESWTLPTPQRINILFLLFAYAHYSRTNVVCQNGSTAATTSSAMALQVANSEDLGEAKEMLFIFVSGKPWQRRPIRAIPDRSALKEATEAS